MPRVLSEQEFEALKARVLASAPDLKNEAEFNRWVGPAMEQALGEAENSAPTPEGSSLMRGLSGVAKNLNPITAVQGLYGAVRHPLDTGGALIQSQLAELQKAAEDFKQGRYSEMVGHGAAGALPLLGPAAAAAGERIGSGDIAGGVGEGVGLVAPFAAGTVAKGVKAGTKAVVQGARAVPKGAAALDALATMAEDASTNRIVDVAAPKIGPNKVRLNARMADIAPQIARDPELASLSRQRLQGKVAAKLEEATAALDDAADSRLVTQQVKTGPVLQKLDEQIAKLTATPVEGSRPVPSTPGPWTMTPEGFTRDVEARPLGQPVEPSPNATQLSTLKQIRAEVAQLGPVAPYESVRRIRQAWDQVAKIKYSPSMTADFLTKQGEANAAMTGTGALRDALAASDPATAAANANYSLYKTAHDILQATEEIERARPTVGRTLMARGLGAAAGASQGGAGMAIGAIVGPLVERVAAGAAPTMKLAMARKFAAVADLLKANKVAEAEVVLRKTARTFPTLVKGAAVPIGRAIDQVPMAAEDQQDRPPAIGRR